MGYTVSVTYTYKLVCDRCAERAYCPTLDEVIKEVKQGWANPSPGHLLCPQCATEDVVPKWRQLVDEREVLRWHTPLAMVLHHLHRLASDVSEKRFVLACIVAIAEAEAGDGWQADPDRARKSGFATWCVEMLMVSAATGPWERVADQAAAWLRDIIEVEAAK